MIVFPDGIDHGADCRFRTEGLRAFRRTPAVVSSLHDQVDLLPSLLANVGGPQAASRRIEGDLPGIPQPKSIDLTAGTFATDEGIVRRDCVGPSRLATIDVDPQDLAEEHVEPLAGA